MALLIYHLQLSLMMYGILIGAFVRILIRMIKSDLVMLEIKKLAKTDIHSAACCNSSGATRRLLKGQSCYSYLFVSLICIVAFHN